jgi:hypothetical protein
MGGAPGVLNAVAIRKPDGSGLYVPAAFARKLEIELQEALKKHQPIFARHEP